jgi:hypothetical protein
VETLCAKYLLQKYEQIVIPVKSGRRVLFPNAPPVEWSHSYMVWSRDPQGAENSRDENRIWKLSAQDDLLSAFAHCTKVSTPSRPFVILPLALYYPDSTDFHLNLLLVNYTTREVQRLDPERCDKTDPFCSNELDVGLGLIFEQQELTYLAPMHYCPKPSAKGFPFSSQSSSGGKGLDTLIFDAWGEERAHKVFWTVWWADISLAHPGWKREKLFQRVQQEFENNRTMWTDFTHVFSTWVTNTIRIMSYDLANTAENSITWFVQPTPEEGEETRDSDVTSCRQSGALRETHMTHLVGIPADDDICSFIDSILVGIPADDDICSFIDSILTVEKTRSGSIPVTLSEKARGILTVRYGHRNGNGIAAVKRDMGIKDISNYRFGAVKLEGVCRDLLAHLSEMLDYLF